MTVDLLDAAPASRAPVMLQAHGTGLPALTVVPFSGSLEVLQAATQLQHLAEGIGQHELPSRLAFQFSVPYFGDKLPHAVHLQDAGGRVRAAVHLMEHRILGRRSGVFTSVDAEGELTVLAPQEHRLAAAQATLQYLEQHGARLALLSLLDVSADQAKPRPASSQLFIQAHALRRTLPLLATVDETLAQMGARSRRNLRYAARKIMHEFSATFVENAAITQEELLAFNRICPYPVPDWVLLWRHSFLRDLPTAFVSGLRASDGRWLSLIGGRRHGKTSVIDWQMNRADMGALSVGTAMRHFQIAAEIRRGTTALQFAGGTPHSMQHAFLPEEVTELLWVSRPYAHPAVRWLATKVTPQTHRLKAVLAASLIMKP